MDTDEREVVNHEKFVDCKIGQKKKHKNYAMLCDTKIKDSKSLWKKAKFKQYKVKFDLSNKKVKRLIWFYPTENLWRI